MRVSPKGLPATSGHRELERQVLERLQWLRFGAVELGIQALLNSQGLREVTIVGNMHWRGRSEFGGMDIRAWRPADHGRQLTLVQVKHPEEKAIALQRRFVDELRGVMLREGATHGMIITTGTVAKPAERVADRYPRLPVQLINGQQLARVMVRRGLGVRFQPLPINSIPELVIDELFFERLEEMGHR